MSYVEALVLSTSKEKVSNQAGHLKRKARPEEIARIEMEMDSLGKRYKACEQVFSEKLSYPNNTPPASIARFSRDR
ncbi:hypothetical protein [Luteolibacter luteus]|uniref:Uncharacterized protein n=1 Tax=Luteolibacter luteus TaxID=2728835 RepID=A0A858RG50_9BACT|nr:hypothetical protein [Luteolibacter luteus]QJE95270.1 hypothetical protein HHL09_05590 [Luteolibacter luteus]